MTVRNTDELAAYATADAIFRDLHGMSETVLNSTRYLLVRGLQTPESIGRDGRGRSEVVCNFAVMKDR